MCIEWLKGNIPDFWCIFQSQYQNMKCKHAYENTNMHQDKEKETSGSERLSSRTHQKQKKKKVESQC